MTIANVQESQVMRHVHVSRKNGIVTISGLYSQKHFSDVTHEIDHYIRSGNIRGGMIVVYPFAYTYEMIRDLFSVFGFISAYNTPGSRVYRNHGSQSAVIYKAASS